MVDASILVSLFINAFLLPGFHVVLLSRHCVKVFPSAFVFIMSAKFVFDVQSCYGFCLLKT